MNYRRWSLRPDFSPCYCALTFELCVLPAIQQSERASTHHTSWVHLYTVCVMYRNDCNNKRIFSTSNIDTLFSSCSSLRLGGHPQGDGSYLRTTWNPERPANYNGFPRCWPLFRASSKRTSFQRIFIFRVLSHHRRSLEKLSDVTATNLESATFGHVQHPKQGKDHSVHNHITQHFSAQGDHGSHQGQPKLYIVIQRAVSTVLACLANPKATSPRETRQRTRTTVDNTAPFPTTTHRGIIPRQDGVRREGSTVVYN